MRISHTSLGEVEFSAPCSFGKPSLWLGQLLPGQRLTQYVQTASKPGCHLSFNDATSKQKLLIDVSQQAQGIINVAVVSPCENVLAPAGRQSLFASFATASFAPQSIGFPDVMPLLRKYTPPFGLKLALGYHNHTAPRVPGV